MTGAVIEQQNADERLKEMFRRLLELYERHAQERQLIVKEKEEMNRLVQLLVSQTKEVGQYENGIRKRIQDCIKESANAAMNNIEKSIAEKFGKSNEEFINKNMQISQLIESVIEEFHAERKQFPWKIFSVAILSGILSSFLMTWILMPKPTLPLTTEQISYLQEGQMLVQMWPKLTKQEQARLKMLSYQVMNADVKA
jgi:hypothetical protein